MKAVILAAGYGSRLQPFTSFRPKHMLPVAGKYVLERGIDYLRDTLGIHEMILVVGYLRNAIMDYFGTGSKHGVNIKYVIQHTTDKRGLGAALSLVEDHIQSDFILYLADNLFEANLKTVVDKHFSESNHATIHIEKNPEPERFGVAMMNDDGKITQLVEKPEIPPSNYVVSGFYVFSPLIFSYLKKISPSKRNEFELTDAIQLMIDDGARVYASLIDGWRQDIGRPKDLLLANKKFLSSGHEKVNGSNVNSKIIHPVFVHKDAKVINSTIGPYVMLEKGVVIENSKLKNTVILEDTMIRNSEIEHAIVGAKSIVSNLFGSQVIAGDYTVLRANQKHTTLI